MKKGVEFVDKIPAVNKVKSEIVEIVENKVSKLKDCELKTTNNKIKTGNPKGNVNTDFIAGKDGINESIKNGKHVISKHVGKTDAELLERISSNKSILGASTFKDGKIANSVINSALTDSKNIEKINIWIAKGAKGNLPILYNGKAVIGRGVQQGSKIVENYKNAKIILKSNGKGGFDILTAYLSK